MFFRCSLSQRWWTVSVPGCSRPSAAPPAHSRCSDRLAQSFLCCCICFPYTSIGSPSLHSPSAATLLSWGQSFCFYLFLIFVLMGLCTRLPRRLPASPAEARALPCEGASALVSPFASNYSSTKLQMVQKCTQICAAQSCHSLAKTNGELTSIMCSHPNVSMCLTACSQTANGRHSSIACKTPPVSAWLPYLGSPV